MSTQLRNYILHVLWMLLFLSIPIFTSPDFGADMWAVNGFRRHFLSYVLLIGFCYLNYFYLIPKYYLAKRYVLFAASLLICYAVIALVPNLLFDQGFIGSVPTSSNIGLPPRDFSRSPGRRDFVQPDGAILQFLLVLALSVLLRVRNQLRAISSEKLKAEVSYLKAQMNPHFLFNTLNSLYALTIQKSDAAPDAVLRLSNMMRYVVTESASELVAMAKEISYIRDYVDMQRLRIAEQSNLEFDISGNTEGKRIAPLVLIPFIENAFKYGINTEEDWHIGIRIAIAEKELTLEVSNNKVNVQLPEENGSAQGISNTRKRLEIIYPGQHELKVTETDAVFKVWLKITLT